MQSFKLAKNIEVIIYKNVYFQITALNIHKYKT